MKYTIEYASNNSGGDWWLEDNDWYELEKNGWKVNWVKDNESYGGDDRWLGALAREATKDFDSIEYAVREFEQITGQILSDGGCSCCGSPHRFSIINNETNERDYISGEDFVDYINEDKDEI